MQETKDSDRPAGPGEWVVEACAGDEVAFGKLFKTHYSRIQRTVWGILGNEAEAHDVSQAAWIKAWQQRERFNFQSEFSTWVHRIAINGALDALRQQKRLRNRIKRLLAPSVSGPEIDRVHEATGSPDRELLDRERGRRIEKAVAALPPDQRTVLVLREYEGYSYEEIAKVVGCKPGTVMSRLHLARKKLKARLAGDLS